MNKIIKTILAVTGACNKVMSIFIPLGLALLIISSISTISGANAILLWILAAASSFFRAISIWLD